MFIGRKKEIDKYSDFINGNSGCFLVYGKRRIGKTTLIKHCYKENNINVLYFECFKNSLEFNLEMFQNMLIENNVINEKITATSFSQIFYILNLLSKDLHIVIDEYNYLNYQSNQASIDSDFQRICDNYLNNIHLTLCGSMINIMSNLVESNNPLFGRMNGYIFLNEFNYLEASYYYQDKSTYDKIAFYSVFGGSPYILNKLDSKKTLKDNIIALLLDNESLVYNYTGSLLFLDIPSSYNIEELAVTLKNGKMTLAEIENKLHIDKTGNMHKRLKSLINMDLIKKTNPINKPTNAKLTFYELNDNLVRFFYSFIYPNKSIIASINKETFYDNYIDKSITTFISKRFEDMVKSYIKLLNRNDVINIGCYYYNDSTNHKNGEFDVAIKLTNNTYDIIEVKYYKDKIVSNNEIVKEKEQVNNIKELNVNDLYFITTSNYETNDKNYLLADIMYNF